MASNPDSTGGTTSQKGEAARARAEVGGVGSSADLVPDLWFGELAGERSDATCSAGVKRREGGGDGPARAGLKAPDKVRQLQITLYRIAIRTWNSESRMRENRPSGLMRGGKQTVTGIASQSVASRLLYTRPRVSLGVSVQMARTFHLGTRAG